jgi:uncharacterized protein with HEPN domain
MRKRDYRDYLQDIIDSIIDIESFTENMTFEDFNKGRKTINAVIRSIEVIGEATKKIPKPIRDKNPSIPWKKMRGMKDKMIHEYFGVNAGILWKLAQENIPPLKPLIRDVLKSLDE